MEVLRDLLWTFVKFVLKIFTGKCEIERICQQSFHCTTMTEKVLSNIKRSKQLKEEKKIIFPHLEFDVQLLLNSFKVKKRISGQLAVVNLGCCLHSIRMLHRFVNICDQKKKSQFDKSHKGHVNLLDSFWEALKPNIRRRQPSVTDCVVSSDWGEVGFQGHDPSTDFRGMGLLSLENLNYFATTRNESAKNILLESHHPRRFFPFAATGINVTAFLMELLHEGRFNAMIFRYFEEHFLHTSYATSAGPSASEECVRGAFDALQVVYCEVFEEFAALWVQRDPRDVMSFPAIFAEVKTSARTRYPAAR